MTATQAPLGTTTIAQVGLIVRDIEAKAHAWSSILGLPMPEIIVTDGVDVAHTTYLGEASPARAKLAFFHFGPLDVELIEPIGGPSTWKDHLDAHGESMHHLAFRIQGTEEKLAYLTTKGLKTLQRGDYTGGRYSYVDGSAQLGAILELLEDDQRV
jgi:catechol 2,3-dioxygenase-like lactoylglutathione lyase family enzyme